MVMVTYIAPRMLICMHNWGSSLHLPPHRRSSIIVISRGATTASHRALQARQHGAVACDELSFPAMLALSPTTLLAQPLLATRPRILRPIEPRLAARLDAIVAIPQSQSSPDSRPATNAVL